MTHIMHLKRMRENNYSLTLALISYVTLLTMISCLKINMLSLVKYNYHEC